MSVYLNFCLQNVVILFIKGRIAVSSFIYRDCLQHKLKPIRVKLSNSLKQLAKQVKKSKHAPLTPFSLFFVHVDNLDFKGIHF